MTRRSAPSRSKRRPAQRGKKRATRRTRAAGTTPSGVQAMTTRQVRSLRRELDGRAARPLDRWNADPQDVQRSLARLVLALVEFLRRLMERQAVRRMEARTLSDAQAEDMGLALMRLERTIRDLAAAFGLDPDDLNLELGPLGRLH